MRPANAGVSSTRIRRRASAAVDAMLAATLERCARLVPAVAGQAIALRAVGLRPGRERLRIEEVPGRALRTVAAYGHGGSGVTLSWGTAQRVAALLA